MFKKLGSLFKKLWNAIRKVLAVLLIIIAVILICFFTFGSGLLIIPFLGIALTPTMALLAGILALTCAFVIDADTSSKVVGKVGDALGDAAKAVGSAAGSVVGGAASGLMSSPIFMWGAIGVGAYLLLSGDGKQKTDTKTAKSVKSGSSTSNAQGVVPVARADGKKGSSPGKVNRPATRSGDLSNLLLA